ncbi:TPA: hypothetical protein ACVO0U_004255, partial [Vibrio alginolyticus]
NKVRKNVNEYIILEKDDISIAVNIIEEGAGEEIRGLQKDSFTIVCESIKALSAEKAIKLWSQKEQYREDELRFKKMRGESDSTLHWENLSNEGFAVHHRTFRTKVPGGWLVSVTSRVYHGVGCGVTFVPDPQHLWDGNST